MISAMIDPGDIAPTAPPSMNVNQNNAAICPQIGPKIVIGLLNAYGKETSPIPPMIWMIAAPGADFFAVPFPNTQNANISPTQLPLLFLISAVLTYFVGFNDSMIPESERYDAKGTVTPVASSIENNGAIAMKFYSPADGNVVPLTEVSDQAFSSEALGKGIAVKPINGTIVSPIAGTVSAVYPTAHAYGIKGNNNEEILVHIGIDTVKLEGKYFTPNVKTNDIVMPGDLLATIELDKIIEAGYDPTVMVIDTADSSKRNVTLLAKNTVHAKDDLVLIESI